MFTTNKGVVGHLWSLTTFRKLNEKFAQIDDFHLLLHLKKHLSGKKIDDYEVQEEVLAWFKGQVADFYDLGIQKLVPRLNKCLDIASDCVEK